MTRPEAHVLLGYLKRYRTEHITCARKYDVASEMVAEVMNLLNSQGGLATGNYFDKETVETFASNVQGTVTKRLGDMTEPQLAEFIIKTVNESIARNAMHPDF